MAIPIFTIEDRETIQTAVNAFIKDNYFASKESTLLDDFLEYVEYNTFNSRSQQRRITIQSEARKATEQEL